jgi:hypothetical protein
MHDDSWPGQTDRDTRVAGPARTMLHIFTVFLLFFYNSFTHDLEG